MRVMISGGSGLVGRNIRERLGQGFDVFAPARMELDLFNSRAVASYIQSRKPDVIIHCAGTVGGIQANIREPVRFLIDNLELGKNVVMAAAEAGIPKLINLGSSCMYPRAAPNPLHEDCILKGELEPTNEGYAIAKITVQRLCSYLNRERSDLSYKTIIPCNLYGKWDKFDPRHSHMIPAVIRKLHDAKVEKRDTVDIWGTGKARREFMYAGDLADFILYALDRFDAMPELINVGLGHDHSIDEYYRAVAEVVGYRGRFNHDVTKPEGMERKLVDVAALHAFGWKARTSLVDGLRATYQFYLEQENAV